MLVETILRVLLVGGLWPVPSLGHLPPAVSPRLAPREACAEQLEQQLSSEAQIYCSGSDEFANSTQRWSTLDAPTFQMTVEVATESDVVAVVRYANARNISFLPVNNAHGAIVTTGKVHNGIMIWMRQLNSVDIADDGQTATFGGGILDKEVTDGLWAAGKQTVTGGCECVSVIGPGLGGGHGLLQARHGLVSDQFVSLNMVMGDGTLQKVDSNHELWWAVRGAGHNFGIVTSITTKIYDVQHAAWAFQNFTFTGDKVQALYTALNDHVLKNGTQSVDVFHYSLFVKVPPIDAEKPVIFLYILQEGVEKVDDAYTAPLLALGPVATSAGSGDYTDTPGWIGWGNDAATCQNTGLANSRFPIDLQTYDIPAQGRVYDLLTTTINETPALDGSIFLFEGYAQQGVKAVPSADSAYPFRGSNLLVSPVMRWIEDGEELADEAVKTGEALREILHKASGLKQKRTYVNYAFGTESVVETYGDEAWRQEKLSALKRKYDPLRRFDFYAPIPQSPVVIVGTTSQYD